MNKSGLIDAVSKTTSLAKREAEEAVNAVVHVVSREVRSGRRVVVAGFGSFNPTRRGARMGRNPQTGVPVSIAASRGVRFAASGTLKDVLNGKATLPTPATTTTKRVAAKKTTARVAPTTVSGATKISTKKVAKKTTGPATRKVVGRAPARTAIRRSPASKAARPSARKAAGRPPARKAAKRPAKKAVRRA